MSQSQYNFTALKNVYPSVLDEMAVAFTSHQFILVLAQRNQRLYIEALYAHRHTDGPFRDVHGALAKLLHGFATPCGKGESRNIFGIDGKCEFWRKRP
ncbi:MAG: hypothetical protein OXC18_19275 [Desulfurellaceae bacterium]|nr:hypothetical protein [Desulfurellaceae bacterium]